MLLLELPQRPSLLSKSHHTNVNYFRLFSNCSPRSLPFRRPVPWDDVLQSIPSVPVQPYFPFDLIHINFQFPLAHASPSQQTFRTSGYSISGTLVPGAGGGRGKNRIPRIEPTFSPRCATQTCSLTFPARRSSGRCYLRAAITSNARGSTVLPPISKSCLRRK